MFKSLSSDTMGEAKSQHGYAEMDPSSRYGRFNEILGKGATKTVFKAFDEVLAMEVAWNQVKINCVFRSPEELQRLYSEVHLLKNLNHTSIMRFHISWIDVHKKTFNFITEMFTAGSLREYRQKHKRVHVRAIKDWARQILEGLAYLHSCNPPVIHRDLKCDNIFINGHLGQVKIGDLGLAATLCDSRTAHSVIGTPEFMAPEMYEEDYNELVDIYSFGMCVLEMLTSEYPYSECSNPAQIYKKVTSGKFPKAFHQIECDEARLFVGKCLENVSSRPSAKELLMEPFLIVQENDQLISIPKSPPQNPTPTQKIPDIPSLIVRDQEKTIDMTITGSMNPEDGAVFLKVFISDKIGKARNIYFPFDVASDTAQDVATEMVKELDIKDWKPFDIAEMIDKEILNLIPTWKKRPVELLQNLNCHGFYYDEDDDDDNDIPHPLHSPSSQASYQVSPRSLFSSFDSIHDQSEGITSSSSFDWTPGNIQNYDDSSCQSSLHSYNSYNFTYCSDNEDDTSSRSFESQDQQNGEKTKNSMRLTTRGHRKTGRPDIPQHKNIKRGSDVDIRSQLLHRSLVEEVHKRRLFKTVTAIENTDHEPRLP